MNHLLTGLLTASIQGSIVILAVLVLRLVLYRTPKKYICLLWMLAGLRLLLPIPIESSLSLQPSSVTLPAGWNPGPVLWIVWLVLALGILGYSVLSYLHLKRLVLDAVKVPGGWESDRIETAFVLGFLKPKIYIPAGMSPETRKQILAHERTHLDKGDHWIKLIGFLALALHWFNPLVWLAYYFLCKDIELACDQRVVQFMELPERKAYSSALLQCSTNRVHYAACPVAFGEVSVKYRIRSVLNYRKPSFWVGLLGVLAVAFTAVCLGTSPASQDPEAALLQASQEDPASFTVTTAPASPENPDWDMSLTLIPDSNQGGTLTCLAGPQLADFAQEITAQSAALEHWDGQQWNALSLIGEPMKVWFSIYNDPDQVFYWSPYITDLRWTSSYGALTAGDYQLRLDLAADDGSTGTFYVPFHIYRAQLASAQEAAVARCKSALSELRLGSYTIALYETAPNGQIQMTETIRRTRNTQEVNFYRGQYRISGGVSEDGILPDGDSWAEPFSLDQNRRILFPEGQSVISDQEIVFRSVWADVQGNPCQGTSTYRFSEDGKLSYAACETVTTLPDGTQSTHCNQMELTSVPTYRMLEPTLATTDSFTAQENSPWGIFFRVDDDLLTPGGGEVWLASGTVGISNDTTDGQYWLEQVQLKNHSPSWVRLGDETTTGSLGSVSLRAQTQMFQVDWTGIYGQLEAGTYRMGLHFYRGGESIIQYADFEISAPGGIYGEGGEEAIARVDAALDKLRTGSYNVTKYEHRTVLGQDMAFEREHIWRSGDKMAVRFLPDYGSPNEFVADANDEFYSDWMKRNLFDSPYENIYFPEGYSVISPEEITFLQSFGSESLDFFCSVYTYRFDTQGNLTEIRQGYTGTDYYVVYTLHPVDEAEIAAKIAAFQKAE